MTPGICLWITRDFKTQWSYNLLQNSGALERGSFLDLWKPKGFQRPHQSSLLVPAPKVPGPCLGITECFTCSPENTQLIGLSPWPLTHAFHFKKLGLIWSICADCVKAYYSFIFSCIRLPKHKYCLIHNSSFNDTCGSAELALFPKELSGKKGANLTFFGIVTALRRKGVLASSPVSVSHACRSHPWEAEELRGRGVSCCSDGALVGALPAAQGGGGVRLHRPALCAADQEEFSGFKEKALSLFAVVSIMALRIRWLNIPPIQGSRGVCVYLFVVRSLFNLVVWHFHSSPERKHQEIENSAKEVACLPFFNKHK